MVDIIMPEAAAKTANRAAITLAVSEVRRHLGTTLDWQQRRRPERKDRRAVPQQRWVANCVAPAVRAIAVTLPSWRLDLEREIDLIEEVARVYGYNKFANTLPASGTVVELPNADKETLTRARMLALGFSETISSTFCSAADAAIFAPVKDPPSPWATR